jgi:hypothetical protein
LTQDEITGQRHHHPHGYGQKQNQSGAQAHTAPLSGERRIDRLSVATLFYGIKQISQQISRHTHEACFMRLAGIPMFQIATFAKPNLRPEEFPPKSCAS